MYSLADALRKRGSIQLGIVSCLEGESCSREEIDGTVHLSFPPQYSGEYESVPSPTTIATCVRIVADFKPDIVHIHGTEYFYGLLTARGHINTPSVVSIQGLINVCQQEYFGGLIFRDLLRAHTLADIVLRKGLVHRKLQFKKRALIEREIIAGNRYFIGRTMWDRAHLREINPTAVYYHCDELMRPPFYHLVWKREHCRQFTIFSPTSKYPLKGIHLLLRAAAILKREFPAVKLRVADSTFAHGLRDMSFLQRMKTPGYSRYLGSLIDELGLHNVVQVTGPLNDQQMANELSMAHVFVAPSLVENGCNSLQEAALVGTPCVVSLAGGMTSMIEDRRTAIGFPKGDEAMLAEGIRMIFKDDSLAANLSHEARRIAFTRNAESRITDRMLEIYKTICMGEDAARATAKKNP